MGKGRWLNCGCVRHSKSQSSWNKTAVFSLLIGPILFFLAMALQDDFSWSGVLGVEAVNGLGPSSFSSKSRNKNSDASSSCMSRIQHMNYRPASQRIAPSRAWENALRAYERFHTKCSQGRNWTQEFLQVNKSAAAAATSSEQESCRVLVFIEGPAGLGNRLLSLASAFLYALLTDRAFLMDSRGHLAKLLCQPFQDSSWLLPSDFPFEALDAAPSLGEASALNFSSCTAMVSLHLDHAQSNGDQQFFCPSTRESLKSVPWLTWTSNQYYVPRFFTFPELWQPLVSLFPNVSLAFTHLARSLLLPSNPVWDKILRIYSSYLSQAQQLVGIQIRRHSIPNSGEYDDAAFHRILCCLVDNKMLPNIGRANGASRAMSLSYAVLVTSLQIRFFEELRDVYTNMATVDGSLVRVHMVSHEGMEWHSYDQAHKAFVEMWLLSLSDRVATSSFSTFGYIAQGLGALRPLIVDLRGDIAQQTGLLQSSAPSSSRHCFFGQSVDPCNHYAYFPLGSQCLGNESALSDAHQTWINHHVRFCQDFPQGLQLVT
ncbi:xyloglucan fucosyltransferase [Marchantia polymorpha subsp. ruderalis]